MAVGDIKGEEVFTIQGTAAKATTKGYMVHYNSTLYMWMQGSTNNSGKKGVALTTEAVHSTDMIVAVWGRVEVKAGAAIKKGQRVRPGDDGFAYPCTDPQTLLHFAAGVAMEDIANQSTGTIFLGLM